MEWFERKRNFSKSRYEPNVPAIMVSFGKTRGESERVRFWLSSEFVKQARLQPGDKLQAGINDEGQLCLRRHPAGNAVSKSGSSKKGEASRGRSYVAFHVATFPQVVEWAKGQTARVWLYAIDEETHFRI